MADIVCLYPALFIGDPTRIVYRVVRAMRREQVNKIFTMTDEEIDIFYNSIVLAMLETIWSKYENNKRDAGNVTQGP